VGTWWGGKDQEVDVVALDERGQSVLVGSCKWTNQPMDVSDYSALLQVLSAAAGDLKPVGGDGPGLALFSREGFTDRLQALAAVQEPQRLLLIDPDTMYRGQAAA
jgi:hypothetical protein